MSVFYLPMKEVENGSNTAEKKKIYASIGGELTAEKEHKILELKKNMDEVLGNEYVMEKRYQTNALAHVDWDISIGGYLAVKYIGRMVLTVLAGSFLGMVVCQKCWQLRGNWQK